MKQWCVLIVSSLLVGAAQADIVARWMLEGEPGNQGSSVATEFAPTVTGALCSEEPDILASWDFQGVTTAVAIDADQTDDNISSASITRTVENNGSSGYLDTFSMRENNQETLADAINHGSFITWTLEPAEDHQFSIQELFIRMSAANTTRQIALFSDATGYDEGDELATWTIEGANVITEIDLLSVSELQSLSSSVEFRLVAWGAGNEFQNTGIGWAFNGGGGADLVVYGFISEISEPLPEPEYCDPALTRTSSIGGSGLANTFMMRDNEQSSLDDAISAGAYISWTLQPVADETLTVTSLYIRVAAQNSSAPTPPRELALFSSRTGWEASDAIDEWQVVQRGSHTIDLSALGELADIDEAVEFRLVAWNAPDNFSPTAIGYDGEAHGGADDLILFGSTSGDPLPPIDLPVITLSPGGATLSWNAEPGFLYTLLFATDLTGEIEWTVVPEAEDLPSTQSSVSDLPHIEAPLIFYAIERKPE